MFMSPLGGPLGSAIRRRETSGTAPEIVGDPIIAAAGNVGEVGVEHRVEGFTVTGSPAPVIAYDWQIAGVTVATTPTYTPTSSTVESGFSDGFSDGFGGAPLLSVTITAANDAGTTDPVTTDEIQIFSPPPNLFTAVIDKPSAMTGETLTVLYDGAQPENVSVQWKRNGSTVSGAVSESLVASDAGLYSCLVTATTEGGSVALETDPIRVFHIVEAGSVGVHNASTAAATFASAPAEISDQIFLAILSYEGPLPSSMVAEGITLSTFADGATATSGGKTLTLIKAVTISPSHRFFVAAVSGVTGKSSISFSINAPSNFLYLKVHCYQISGYSLENVGWNAAVGSGGSLAVQIAKLIRGLGIGFGNRMPNLAVTPPGWVEGLRIDSPTSGWDLMSGYIAGEAGYQGPITFAQPNAVAGEQALAVSLAPLGVAIPEITSTPTITGGTAPVQGTAITLNIASVSSATTKVRVQVWRDTNPRVPASQAVDYVIGSGDPAPTYTPTSGDVGFALVQSQTPVSADGVVGTQRFSVPTGTVSAVTGGTDPSQLAASKFSFAGTSEANGGIVTVNGVEVQRADFTVKSGITQPAGWEVCLLRTVSSGVTAASGHPDLQFMKPLSELVPTYNGTADVIWRSNGGGADGVTQRGYVYWRHQATGRVIDGVALVSGDTPFSFVSDTGDDVVIPPPPDGNWPTANQTLSTATSAAIVNLVDARIAGGSTATWIVDLPPGNYASLNLATKQLPGKLILRSQGRNYGAVFSNIDMNRCKNVYFQFVRVNGEVNMQSTHDCGIEYNDIYAGVATLNADAGFPSRPFYVQNRAFLVRVDKWSDTAGPTLRARVYMNYIHGAVSNAIYVNATNDSVIAENVFAEIHADSIKCGVFDNVDFINNWEARTKFTTYGEPTASNPNPVSHNDFIQFDSRFGPGGNNSRIIGNVAMKSKWTFDNSSPAQCIFSSKSLTANNLYENNIVLCNSVHGITCEHGTSGAVSSGHIVRKNTAIKLADGFADPGQSTTTCNIQGTDVIRSHNIHSAGWAPGTDSIAIPTTATNRSGGEQYYNSCKEGISFYDFRPIEGKPTHWNYNGTKVGAYERFRDVIVNGHYPKIGAAGAAWKQWYDPRNQITS